MQSVRAEINLKALVHNFNVVKSKVPNSKIISVVKANAYGHGLIQVSKALKVSDAYALTRI